MKPLRPQLRGLISKLTLFYVLLSLPCLIVVESAILIFEYATFSRSVDGGSLLRATERAAGELADVWPSAAADEAAALDSWTQALILRLQRPHGGLIEDESYLLLELAEVPFAAAVLDAGGKLIAQAPAQSDWLAELPAAGADEYRRATEARVPLQLAGADAPFKIRRLLAPVRSASGSLHGYLFLELRLPVPWHRLLLDLSLEWPIILGYLLVFGVASSIFLAAWVTRRLNRVASAASAWSRGDFSGRIDDRSRDELGRLSGLLDGMALELKGLMQSRAQLATLAERQRLARDLHDTVKQQAFALNLQLATLRRQLAPGAAADRAAQAERLSGQIQQELAQILDELRASDAALPFVERLHLRASGWAQASGIELVADLAVAPNLPAADQDTLLRIADEALANVLRHSGATRVLLTLSRSADTMSLAIVDNGRGGIADASPGMGIANMRDRTSTLPRGNFSIDSDSSGTRVTIRFSAAA